MGSDVTVHCAGCKYMCEIGPERTSGGGYCGATNAGVRLTSRNTLSDNQHMHNIEVDTNQLHLNLRICVLSK